MWLSTVAWAPRPRVCEGEAPSPRIANERKRRGHFDDDRGAGAGVDAATASAHRYVSHSRGSDDLNLAALARRGVDHRAADLDFRRIGIGEIAPGASGESRAGDGLWRIARTALYASAESHFR